MEKTFGQRVIEKALAYANFEWYASEKNVMHGTDSNGYIVNTPDVTWKGEMLDCGWWKPNQVNVGVPYCWGRMSTLEEFTNGIKEGRYAGNVPDNKAKTRDVSYESYGVDCSGLLSLCWELPKKISTGLIEEYADIVKHLEDIRQGDVFAKIGSHVMFFVEFLDDEKKEVTIIDATRSIGKVSQRVQNVEELFHKGYRVYRKKSPF